MINYDKNKESSCIQYWDVNSLYGWGMSQKLPVNNFEWIKDTSQFNEDFIKSESDERYFLKVYVQYIKKLRKFHNDLFGVRTKLSYYKVFNKKLIRNRNGENWNTY